MPKYRIKYQNGFIEEKYFKNSVEKDYYLSNKFWVYCKVLNGIRLPKKEK